MQQGESGERARESFVIEPWQPRHAPAFRALNLRWVEAHFTVERADMEVLEDPVGTVIAHGGEILFAVREGVALGTVAMKAHGNGRFELSKLGVDPAAQGAGMGDALCRALIERFLLRGGEVLFLETNTVLAPALRLYERLGFVALPFPAPSPFARANCYMEWRGWPAGQNAFPVRG